MSLDQLPGWAREMLDGERVARLGLIDEQDRPRVLPVTFAIWAGCAWSAIDAKPKRAAEPARVARLRRRPDASLLIDRYGEDWSHLAWVEVRGPVSVLGLEEAPGALEALVAKYPQYAHQRPQGPLLRLTPAGFACWRAADG